MEQTLTIPEMMQEILQETDCYLVSQKVDKSNNYMFFIDNDADFKLTDCLKINRKLRNMVDESGLYPDGNYSLEISSPGLEHPLIHLRQYVKNIGRLVEISFQNPELKPLTARLKAVTDKQLDLESTDKKTKTILPHIVMLVDIKQTMVQIEF
jgi:ribosome maturation factor RimP